MRGDRFKTVLGNQESPEIAPLDWRAISDLLDTLAAILAQFLYREPLLRVPPLPRTCRVCS